MSAKPAFVVTGTKADGDVPTVQADLSVAWEAPSGGSQPVTRQELFGSASTTINGGGTRAHVPFTSSSGPDVLVDSTDPDIPTIITTGVYYVQVSVRSANQGPFLLEVELDSGGFDASAYATAAGAGIGVGEACAGFAWYLPAGANVEAWVTNTHASAANDFGIHAAHIQRLS